jgi:hypothetical protein
MFDEYKGEDGRQKEQLQRGKQPSLLHKHFVRYDAAPSGVTRAGITLSYSPHTNTRAET